MRKCICNSPFTVGLPLMPSPVGEGDREAVDEVCHRKRNGGGSNAICRKWHRASPTVICISSYPKPKQSLTSPSGEISDRRHIARCQAKHHNAAAWRLTSSPVGRGGVAQADGIVVFGTAAADLDATQRHAVHRHHTPAVRQVAGDLLSRKIGKKAGV